MRILFISAAYPPLQAGEATNAYYLCKHLAERNLDIHVLTSEGNSGNGDARITVHPIMKNWSWGEMPRMSKFLSQNAPDAIVLMYLGLMYHYHPMVTFAATIAKRRLPRTPFVTRFENVALSSDPARTTFLSRSFRKICIKPWAGAADISYSFGTLLRDSSHVIALCKQHQMTLFEESPKAKAITSLIPPPPNIRIALSGGAEARQRQRTKLGVGPDDILIAFLGYIYPAKGVETLLRAFQIVTRKRQHVKLLFIGGKFGLDSDGAGSYVQRMYALNKELGLQGATIWTGEFKAEEEDASLSIQAADIGVFTFVQGVQLNNSSFSSMAAHGLPMIATRGPWLDEPFLHRENVFLCVPNDPEALSDSILQVIDDAALRDRLGKGALKLASEWFSWQRAAERTLSLLRPDSSSL